ncbi:hypothetical protein [Burkholderia pyrrocinia]|nr:hypothetical protein [Burkholderia pyrrocinia]
MPIALIWIKLPGRFPDAALHRARRARVFDAPGAGGKIRVTGSKHLPFR